MGKLVTTFNSNNLKDSKEPNVEVYKDTTKWYLSECRGMFTFP